MPKVLLLAWDRVSKIKNAFGYKQYKTEDVQELFRKLFNDVQNIHEELAEYINTPSWNHLAFSNYDDDDDEDYTIAITPEEPNNSLSMGDEHLDTIPATKSDEEFTNSNDDSTSIDDDSNSIADDYFSIDNIDYVEASPPNSELVSLDGEIKDDNLHKKLLNINILIAKIESLNDNPTPDSVLKSPSAFPIPVEDNGFFLDKSDTSLFYSDNSLPEFETFSDHTEETSSGSTTPHADYSFPKYDSFIFEIEPDQGELSSIVMEDNLREPCVHVPNVLPTHPTLILDSDFIPSDNSLPESEIFYFDIEEKNSGSTTIRADISLPAIECFNYKSEPDPGELTSIVDFGIYENVLLATNVNLSPEDDQSRLFTYVVWIFLSFLTPNGGALRKCILNGPYIPTTVVVQTVVTTDDSPSIPEHTTVETRMNMSPPNKAHFESEKEAIHLILTGIGDEIYSIVDAYQTAQEMWEAIERLQQGESLNIQHQEWLSFVTIVKQQHKLNEVSYHKLFDILKQYQKEVNELHAKRLARNANPLALVATAEANQDPYYQTSKSQKSYGPSSKPSIPTRSQTTTTYKGKEIAKLITPPSESDSKENNDPEQAQRYKDMQKNLALIAKYFKRIYKPTHNNIRTSLNSRNKNVDTTPWYKNDNQSRQSGNHKTMNVAGARENVGSPIVQQFRIQCFNCKEFGHFAKECRKIKRIKDSTYHKEKMLLCKQAEKGVPLQADQYDWLADTNEKIDEQELEAHYSYMAKIREVPTADPGTDSKPLEHVQNDTGYNVFANDLQHSEQSESISNTCIVETDDSNVIPDSPDMCNDEIVDNAWVKHTKDQFRAPTAKDMDILIKTCLIPLALKSQNDSFIFVHELKQEMHADLKYVESLKKEIDELESDKAEFSNMYDMILATQTRAPQSPQTFRNTNPRMSNSTGVNHKINVRRPQLRINQTKDKVVPKNSQVKLKKTQVEDHPRIPSISNKIKSVTACNDSLNSIILNANDVWATCGKCLVDSDHFARVTKMLNTVNTRTKKPNIVPISTRKPKVYANKSVATPIRKNLHRSPPLRNQKVTIGCCMRNLMHEAMTFDHNSLELEIHDHSNEPFSSNLVPKFVPLANSYITTRVRITIPPSHNNAESIHYQSLLYPSNLLMDCPAHNVLTGLAVLRVTAAFENFALAALTDFMPYFINIALGTMFLLGKGLPIPVVLIPGYPALPSKVSSLVVAVTLHLGLVKSNSFFVGHV
uniref:CCHC-type domain-containing protein n=1 Tax=Tanacetum cinerariifolium TaxID=118510 RepID=A0A6L2KB02_TANCI|nr:hypothetical protein [Tanacetum cinerariifolium]